MTPPAAAGETTARTGTGSHGEDEDLGVQDGDLALASLFPAPSREQWQRLVAGVLAKSGKQGLEGQDAEKALSTALEDGLFAQPLYTADDQAPDAGFPGVAPYVRGNRPQGAVLDGWDIRQYHSDPRPDSANQAVLADLANGGTSLWLEVGDQGLPIDALPKVLDGVYLDLAAVVLDAGPDFGAAAQRLFKLYDERGVPEGQATGNLGADPLGLLARTGEDGRTESLLAEAAELAGTCVQRYPGIRTLTVDALAYHDAGASPAQELGSALATAVAYLRQLTDAGAGLSVADAAGQLEFRFAATADQFLTIAKLRAARRLWARVLEASGAPQAAASNRLHAVTSSVMMTERDPWVNILRTTVACMAAGVGGAESVTVLPFDDVVGLPDDFTRRVARNTQSILLDESHLGRVVDPAGGSWYVERLTDDLARAAWAWFQEIERTGGMRSALVGGLVAERIGATWERRTAAIARRREPILGVSEFPNLGEKPLTSVPRPERRGGGLPRVRRAEAFEALRDRAQEAIVRTGSRPRIALVALGPEAVYSARSSFAANLFQAGGVEGVVIPVPVESGVDAEAIRAALADSEAKIACLCSSDALYAEHVTEVARILAEAGIQRIWLAGRPGERAEEYRQAGVEEFVYVGCDVLSALNTAYAAIGEFS
ncbi:methylmalonyl-CoA mutase family protein [Catenulispora pinisilvae]|uniref:methylmalonyl-CoA mutase family protein n=1 Tax=Catenulispora pinisilvae TaxID=2705253 RepID=UPI0018915224|nr:methylmalonyl-CoA mutase family protein [Catenulispora pinisilvae]